MLAAERQCSTLNATQATPASPAPPAAAPATRLAPAQEPRVRRKRRRSLARFPGWRGVPGFPVHRARGPGRRARFPGRVRRTGPRPRGRQLGDPAAEQDQHQPRPDGRRAARPAGQQVCRPAEPASPVGLARPCPAWPEQGPACGGPRPRPPRHPPRPRRPSPTAAACPSGTARIARGCRASPGRMKAGPPASAPTRPRTRQAQKIASSVEACPGSRLHVVMASSNSLRVQPLPALDAQLPQQCDVRGRPAETDAPDPPPLPRHGAQTGPVLHGYSPIRASRKPILVRSSAATRRNAAPRSASPAGSAMLQWISCGWPGNSGQTSRTRSHNVIT